MRCGGRDSNPRNLTVPGLNPGAFDLAGRPPRCSVVLLIEEQSDVNAPVADAGPQIV